MDRLRSNWATHIAIGTGAILNVLGAMVLVGWRIHSILLVQVFPIVAPMQRMTALSFLLCGFALILAAVGSRRAASACALLVLLPSTLVGLEYALNTQFGIDELLGPDYILVHVSNPGRMAPMTVLCFMGASLALLATSSRRLAKFASVAVGIPGSMLLAVGIVGMLGYLLGQTEIYGWSHFNRVSLPASAGNALLGAGLLALAWRASKTKQGAPEWLPFSIGLGLAAGVLGVWQALMARDAGNLAVLSRIILVAGILGAALVAVTVAQTQRAHKQSRELQASTTTLQQLFDASLNGLVMVNRQGKILRINNKAEAILGYAPNELLGAAIEILVPIELRRQHRMDREAYNAAPQARPMGARRDLYARCKDGSEFPVEVELTPLQVPNRGPVVIAMIVDISARRKAEEALRESEARFRSSFEHSPIGVMLLGLDRRVIKANPKISRMFGYPEEELTQITPLEITHPEDLQTSRHWFEHLFTEEESVKKLEQRYIKKNGQIMWGSVSASVIRDREGRPLYGIHMVEDISERKRAEAGLRLGNEIIAKMEGGLCLVRARDSVIVFANPSFEKMFGYDPGEIIGKHVAVLNAPTRKAPEKIAQEIMAELTRYGLWQGEILNRRKDGSIFWSSATVSTFDHPAFGKVWLSILQDISALKHAEQTLREQATLLDLAHDAIFASDLENRITFWNRGAEDMYGWSAQEMLGRVASELLQTRFPSSFEETRAILQTQGEWEGELEHTKRDGTTIIVASRWSVQRNESGTPISFLEINRDITQRKRAQEQLQNLTERLSLATQAASIGIWDLDLRTNQVVWDNTTFEIFGIPKVTFMVREDFLRWVHPDDLPTVRAAAQRSIQGKIQESVEFRIIRPDGSTRYIYSTEGVVLDGDGNVVRLVGTAADITERKEMEAQIEASARLSALGMMAGGVAHEINNPLSIIHASGSDLLRRVRADDAVPPEIVARDSERIVQTANRIANIIKSMRHLAREGSQDKLRPASVSQIVKETSDLCRERFKNHSVKLILPHIDPAISVSCREVQIAQVLLNLLQNAFDAVMERAGEKWVRLAVVVQDGAVEFSVTDSGPGIPPQLETKIMEPFFTTKEVGKGTGLGLSLSRRIVEDHGSRLELTEENGHPRFSFWLPRSIGKKELYAA